MPIIQRLNGRLDGCWCSFLSAFHVPDPQAQSGASGPSVVFVVESPHICEVRSGECADLRHPLAGDSGKEITSKFIAEGFLCSRHDGRSLGAFVRNGCLDWLRVVNVCELPLQADTYHKLFATGELDLGAGLPSLQAWGKLMVASGMVRAYGTKKSDRWPEEPLVQEIMDDFRERLRGAVSDSSLVVALGKVANVACQKAARREKELAVAENETWQHMLPGESVPHPARNGWKRKEAIRKLQRMFERVSEHRGGSRDPGRS